MTNFGKFLAGALFFMSVAFLAVASVLLAAEYPWGRHDDALPEDYLEVIVDEEGKKKKFGYTRTLSGNLPEHAGKTSVNVVTPTENRADAIIKVNQAEAKRINAETQKLTAEIAVLEKEQKLIDAQMKADLGALQAKKKLLHDEVERVQKLVLAAEKEVIALATKINTIDTEEKANRRILARLQASYEQIKADHERLEAQRVELVDTLRRLVFSLSNLERRNRQLKAAATQ